MTKEQVLDLKNKYPSALVLAHPECTKQVVEIADYLGSTAEIIDYATKSNATEFIICTEVGVEYKLKQNNPTKKFYFVEPTPICHDMKKITLEKILHVLKTNENQIELDSQIIEQAIKPLNKMLELAK